MSLAALRTAQGVGHSTRDRSIDSLSRYLDEIATYPLLTREQEAAIGQRIRGGDRDAVEALVCANLRFVVAVAKQYQHRGVALLDLINEGNLGLMHAAERFDDSRGVKFISYAVWWVRQAMVQALADHAHPVRVPVARAAALRRIGRHASGLRQALGREPTADELADGLDVTARDLALVSSMTRAPVSLDAPFEDGDATLLEVLPAEDDAAADDVMLEHSLAKSVNRALAGLRPRDAGVLRLYFGFDGQEAMTLEAIAVRLGITRERVRQIKDRALSRLRRADHGVLASFARGR